MLFAKISPVAQIIIQNNPYNNTVIDCDYMGIIARPYVLGTEVVNFELQYGTITFDESDFPETFNYVKSYGITLSGNQLTNWGIDDTYIFQEIATILGITIVNYVDIPSESDI